MKQIPASLVTHLSGDTTTHCLLLRVLTKSGDLYGFTNLDVDVTYNPATVDPYSTGDDWGSASHRADNGFTPERMQATADLSVDNTELQGWVAETGITEQQIRAGLFDYAKVRVYRVNYMDLTQGHELVLAGTCGETTFSRNGWKAEFRSLTQQLKQPLSQLYSIKCRAKYGDARCGKAFVWTAGTVTSVGSETDRIFTDTSIAQADDFYALGVVEWLTGDNAGAQMEVDSQISDEVTMALPLPYPIQIGDTYQIRQDCDKTREMCRDTHANLVNFRGEPDIPIADGGTLMVPGAYIRR
ncbi:gene transfer agent FAD/FMN-containing dehydrogenase [Lysobacter dokdonensis DS-58]|uniref:Gene transfer agent FAD/FMN-containing dehydrogenase n=1 Tax=Lysobacter dokdonensis DS-58 TaxID=1300345 RepID=A0A0A2WJE5_9GAMM|nr:DUF2163 domain-containing protein [Lysobacter dokdonensis]KGQ19938.1 gene transfer agent FAD/FMN-containing dehydrogenase [Lysobacter dokdonensis DS-58]